MTASEVERRLRIAEKEIGEAVIYDYRVVNREGEFAETVEEIRTLLPDVATVDMALRPYDISI